MNNNNDVINQNQSQKIFGPKHKAMQNKILDNENMKKLESNFNYNLGEHNFIFINITYFIAITY